MATPLKLFILTSILVVSTTVVIANDDDSISSFPTKAPSSFQEFKHPASLFGPILSNLGFHELAASALSLPPSTAWRGPATVFAPTDSSLLSCPSCSLPLLLQEHTVPGLYSLHYLRNLAFGTKIETLAPGRCITVHYANTSEIFVGGMEVARPDLYNDGIVAVHGIRGFISHLSPLSCNVERMSSLSFPPAPPVASFFEMRLMLKDAMLRLRISGYTILALTLRYKYEELMDLRNMTVFALDDMSIFSSGHQFISHLRFHIVPNRLLRAADLENLPVGTGLPTMVEGHKLVVTTAGGGGPLSPMRINYVKIKSPDLICNPKIVVHGLSMPFQDPHQTAASTWGQMEGSSCDASESLLRSDARPGKMVAPTPMIEWTDEMKLDHGICDLYR